MNIENEPLINYHNTLREVMGAEDDHPFFRVIVEFGITEHQTNTLIKLLNVLHMRKIGNFTEEYRKENKDYFDSSMIANKTFFGPYGIEIEELYQESPPTYNEFVTYLTRIMGNISPELVLIALIKQRIHRSISEYLLADSER